jgi:anti-sigma B factor antagonist
MCLSSSAGERRDTGAFIAQLVSVDPVPLVALAGELDLDTAPLLTDLLERVLAADPHRIELEVSGVTFIDSVGIQALTDVSPRLTGGLGLRGQSAAVSRLRAFLRLDNLLPDAS